MLDIRRVLASAPKKHTEETLNSLTTVWGEALDPSNVLPEYPRPRMQRDNYVMLNGVWDYAIVSVDGEVDVETLARQAIPSRWDGQIVVPFSPEAPLSGVGRTVQPSEFLWYKRKIELPKLADDQRLILHFEAVDWMCACFVNGKLAGTDISDLADGFSLNPNIIRDAADVHELPRVELSGGVEYIFARVPLGAVDSGKTVPFLMIIHKNHYITIAPQAKFSPLDVRDFLAATTERPAGIFSANLAYIISQYEQRVHSLTEKISGARQRLSRYEVQNADFIQFVAIEGSLNGYRSSLEGISSVITQLRDNRHGLFNTRDLEDLEDIDLHIRQILVAISSSVHTISSIQSAYSTIANNVLNQRMKVLTAITILLAIPNVFYGMYGMNIGLPFQHEPWAYVGIVGFTIVLILFVSVFARRIRLF